jgi:hypothetical protein
VLHYTDARADAPADAVAADVRAFLEARGFHDVRVEPTPPTVEDAFMARMGAPEEAGAA